MLYLLSEGGALCYLCYKVLPTQDTFRLTPLCPAYRHMPLQYDYSLKKNM